MIEQNTKLSLRVQPESPSPSCKSEGSHMDGCNNFADTEGRPLNVVFAPWYEAQNPYQRRLADQLELMNVRVLGISCGTRALLETVETENAEVLHLHWLQHFFLRENNSIRAVLKLLLFLFQLILLRSKQTKIVWTVHNLADHQSRHVILDRIGSFAVSRIAHKLIVHSKTAESELRQWLWLSRKADIIPHASYVGDYENTVTRVDARDMLRIQDSTLVFLFFGLLYPYKGALELAESFDQLEIEDSCLMIVGQPKDERLDEQLQNMASKNPTILYVSGFVPSKQVQLYMNASDIVALPYREFLTSGAVNLAMSFGKACLAPDIGYISELLDKKGAFLYDSKAQGGLEQAMQDTAQQRHLLETMGAHNLQLAYKRTWNAMAEKTLDSYQSA